MSSEDESSPKEGPSMPEDADNTAETNADVADATSSLEAMLVDGEDSPGQQTPLAKEQTADAAASTPTLEPLKSVTSQTDCGAYYLKGYESERAKEVAGIIPELRFEETDKLETEKLYGMHTPSKLNDMLTAVIPGEFPTLRCSNCLLFNRRSLRV